MALTIRKHPEDDGDNLDSKIEFQVFPDLWFFKIKKKKNNNKNCPYQNGFFNLGLWHYKWKLNRTLPSSSGWWQKGFGFLKFFCVGTYYI